MATPFLLYGSYGYTGALIAELAVKRGMRPILSGRDAARLKTQADTLGLEYRPITLDDRTALEVALKEVPLVLNCAGPFQRTFQPVVDACLRTGRHYLDITGEIVVFEALAGHDVEARNAGVMLLPGMGFDVVPSDCLAAHLKQRLPSATRLSLAFNGFAGGFSRGTALSAIERIPIQGVVRRDGKLTVVPLIWKTRQIDLGRGPRMAMTIPWGDVSTAFYSTGIPNIETYVSFPRSWFRLLFLLRPLIRLVETRPIQWLLRQIITRRPPGPTAEARRSGSVRMWGEAIDDQDQRAISRMETPEGYSLTVETALAAVSRVLAGDFKPGFQTPSLAYGADFILEFEGVIRKDL
jgi:short subunit dehydrogenase-like uncharacterized protein